MSRNSFQASARQSQTGSTERAAGNPAKLAAELSLLIVPVAILPPPLPQLSSESVIFSTGMIRPRGADRSLHAP